MRLDLIAGDLIAEANRCVDARQYRAFLLAQLRRVAACDTTLYLPDARDQPTLTLDKPARPVGLFWRNRPLYLRELAMAHEVGLREGAYIDTDIYDCSWRSRSVFFNEIIRPQGIRERLIAHLQFRGQTLATVHLCRHGRASRFDRRMLDGIRQLTPILSLTCAAVVPAPPPIFAAAVEERLPDLTRREREIVDYVGRGYQNKEIAALLQLSPNTVRNRLAEVFRKLGVSTRSGLTARIVGGLRCGGRY